MCANSFFGWEGTCVVKILEFQLGNLRKKLRSEKTRKLKFESNEPWNTQNRSKSTNQKSWTMTFWTPWSKRLLSMRSGAESAESSVGGSLTSLLSRKYFSDTRPSSFGWLYTVIWCPLWTPNSAPRVCWNEKSLVCSEYGWCLSRNSPSRVRRELLPCRDTKLNSL